MTEPRDAEMEHSTGSLSERGISHEPDLLSLEGFIDAIEDGRIFGWAFDANDVSRRLRVEIYHGINLLATVTADRFREDLKDYGDRTGHCAFVFNLPKELWAEEPGGFYAVFADTQMPLMRGPRCSKLVLKRPQRAVSNQPDGSENDTALGPGPESQDEQSALMARIEACERAMVTLVNFAHPQSTLSRERSAEIQGVSQRLDQLSGNLAEIEAFVLRNDEQLKATETSIATITSSGKPNFFFRLDVWALIAALAALGISLNEVMPNLLGGGS